MLNLDLYALGLGAGLALAVAIWLWSMGTGDASIADPLWPAFPVLMGIVYTIGAPEIGERAYLVLFLVTLWGARLGAFLIRRRWGQGEDRRYRAMRAEHGADFGHRSLYSIFGLQAILAWILSLPLHAAILGQARFGWLDGVALAVWMLGLFFETVADEQLSDFLSHPGGHNGVMDRGLWRFSRHPNYFGELCIWWAFYLMAASAGGWWTIVSPLVATWMLLTISGIAPMERDIDERRPGYADYRRRTNTIIPGPPRSHGGA